MEIRKAQAVQVRYEAITNKGPGFYEAWYVVGMECKIPGFGGVDRVKEIRVVDSWRPHVEVEWEEYGEVWLTDSIKQINFEDERYQSILDERKEAQRNKDTTGEQTSLGENISQILR